MATENISLEVTETGTEVVKRKLDDLGKTAKSLGSGLINVRITASGVERAIEQFERLNSTLGNLKTLGIAGVLSTFWQLNSALNISRPVRDAVDNFTTFQNRLQFFSKTQEEVNDRLQQLYDISKNTRTAMNSNVAIYTRTRLALAQYGDTAQIAMEFTENLSRAAMLSGSSTEEMNAGLYQLSQALAKGKLDGDEFRSMMENLPFVMMLIAKSLNITIGDLQKLSREGKLTAQVIVNGIQQSAGSMQDLFKTVAPTFGQAVQIFSDQFSKAVGESWAYKDAIDGVAWAIDNMDTVVTAAINAVQGFVFWFAASRILNWSNSIWQAVAAHKAAAASAKEAALASEAAAKAAAQEAQSFNEQRLANIAAIETKLADAKAQDALTRQKYSDLVVTSKAIDSELLLAKARLASAKSAGTLSFALREVQLAETQIIALEKAKAVNDAALITQLNSRGASSAKLAEIEAALAVAMGVTTKSIQAQEVAAKSATKASIFFGRALQIMAGPIGTAILIGGALITSLISISASSAKARVDISDLGDTADTTAERLKKMTNTLRTAKLESMRQKGQEEADSANSIRNQLVSIGAASQYSPEAVSYKLTIDEMKQLLSITDNYNISNLQAQKGIGGLIDSWVAQGKIDEQTRIKLITLAQKVNDLTDGLREYHQVVKLLNGTPLTLNPVVPAPPSINDLVNQSIAGNDPRKIVENALRRSLSPEQLLARQQDIIRKHLESQKVGDKDYIDPSDPDLIRFMSNQLPAYKKPPTHNDRQLRVGDSLKTILKDTIPFGVPGDSDAANDALNKTSEAWIRYQANINTLGKALKQNIITQTQYDASLAALKDQYENLSTPIQKLARDAEEQTASLGLSGQALEIYNKQLEISHEWHGKLTDSQKANIASSVKAIDTAKDASAIMEELNGSTEKYNRAVAATDLLFKNGSIDEVQRKYLMLKAYADEQTSLAAKLRDPQQNALLQLQLSYQALEGKEDLDSSFKRTFLRIQEEAHNTGKVIEDALVSAFDKSAEAAANFLYDFDWSNFKDSLKSIEKDLVVSINTQVIKSDLGGLLEGLFPGMGLGSAMAERGSEANPMYVTYSAKGMAQLAMSGGGNTSIEGGGSSDSGIGGIFGMLGKVGGSILNSIGSAFPSQVGSFMNIFGGSTGLAELAGNAAGAAGGDAIGAMLPWLGAELANGGVVRGLHEHVNSILTTPTYFTATKAGAYRMGGIPNAVAGEAGPEAVVPLARMNNGKLGVNIKNQDNGKSSPVVYNNNLKFEITTPDAESFRASQDQIMRKANAAMNSKSARN